MSRILKAGSTIQVADKLVTLVGDTEISFSNDGSPDAFAGLLAVMGEKNFYLNIGQLAPREYNANGVLLSEGAPVVEAAPPDEEPEKAPIKHKESAKKSHK